MSIIFNSSHIRASSTGYKLENVARTYSKEEIFILDETQLINLLLEKFGKGKKIDPLNYEFKDYFIKIVPYDFLSDNVSGYVNVHTADGMFNFSTYIPRTYIEYQNLENAIDYIFKNNVQSSFRLLDIFYPKGTVENVDEAIFYKDGLKFALTYEKLHNKEIFNYIMRSKQAHHSFYRDKEIFDIDSVLDSLYEIDKKYVNYQLLEMFKNNNLDIHIDMSGYTRYSYSNKFISLSIRSFSSEYDLFIDGTIVNGQIKSLDELKRFIDLHIANLQTKIDQLKWMMK